MILSDEDRKILEEAKKKIEEILKKESSKDDLGIGGDGDSRGRREW